MNSPLSDHHCDVQLRLQVELNANSRASKLEALAADLISQLLDIEISVAKSGFQHGGDAGPAGRPGRRFRIECKKYQETTALSDRELLGEIDQALARDEALEAWVLVATRTVPEQLRQDLVQKGERLGVPVIILSWTQSRTLNPRCPLCIEFGSSRAGLLPRGGCASPRTFANRGRKHRRDQTGSAILESRV